jgi:hypothetical protein
MNGIGTIDVDMFSGERSILARLELGRIIMNDETFVFKLIVAMTTLAVSTAHIFIDSDLLTIPNELKVS